MVSKKFLFVKSYPPFFLKILWIMVSEEAPRRKADSEEAPRRRADSDEAPRRKADYEEAPRRSFFFLITFAPHSGQNWSSSKRGAPHFLQTITITPRLSYVLNYAIRASWSPSSILLNNSSFSAFFNSGSLAVKSYPPFFLKILWIISPESHMLVTYKKRKQNLHERKRSVLNVERRFGKAPVSARAAVQKWERDVLWSGRKLKPFFSALHPNLLFSSAPLRSPPSFSAFHPNLLF